ncbi:GGDEF domain-containing protein [Inhella gelatinilytica]|uniref:diguanylate cyclase n=1 Tax=Inhella gelatinilytica TaxID=2795030 RepID=A0A931N9M0_9BURK|nr:GGDEF domain-containing protein [Inhella gelatinilytica]MBH9551508.1 GGDEF domain-containing protein [Inhella gelatinilytica]
MVPEPSCARWLPRFWLGGLVAAGLCGLGALWAVWTTGAWAAALAWAGGGVGWAALAGVACVGHRLLQAVQSQNQQAVHAQQQIQTLQQALKAKDQQLAESEAQGRSLMSQWQDSLKALQVQHRDLQDAHAELALVAESDSLGVLGSRRALEERLNRIVHAVGERRAQAPRYAFLIVDLDELQSINAKWGRHVGDFVLGVVSTRLALAQREGDLLVRWGGEEFLALIPADDPAAARACAERLRLAVAAHPVALPWGEVVQLTVSVGYACWPFAPERALSWQEAVLVAEWAMQQAKANGRNRSVGGVPGEPGLSPESADGAMTPIRLAQWAAAGQIRALAGLGNS